MTGDQQWQRDFLAALGYLVVQAGYLEEALIDLIWIVSGKTEIQLIEGVRGGTLGSLISSATQAFESRISAPVLRSRLDAAKPVLARALDLRNQFVHANWVFGASAMVRHRRPKKGRVVEMEHKITTAEVESALEEISDATEAMWNLYDETVAVIPLSEIHPRGGMVLPDGTYLPGGVTRVPSPSK